MPTPVQVVDGQGLVWDADGALALRKLHRLLGDAIGTLAGYKQQTAVQGLPLLLVPEEVTLALSHGWIELYCLNSKQTALPSTAAEQPDQGAQQQSGWHAALANKSFFHIPVTPAAAVQNAPFDRKVPAWTYPSTQEERDRYAVFQDLYAKGFFITSGCKFGADFLAYPGDPMLYHALYCIHVLPPARVLRPAFLAAGLRGSHAARKHLVLASVHQEAGDDCSNVQYVTFAPAADFGS